MSESRKGTESKEKRFDLQHEPELSLSRRWANKWAD